MFPTSLLCAALLGASSNAAFSHIPGAQSAKRLYCVWLDDSWNKDRDRPFRPIRDKVADWVEGKVYGVAFDHPLPREADRAIADWKRDKDDPVKLYRATLYVLNARAVNFRYAQALIGHPDRRALFDQWLRIPSQNSYEFTRVGYMFVSVADISFIQSASGAIDAADIGWRLLQREPKDLGLTAAYIWSVSMASLRPEHIERAVRLANEAMRRDPRRVGFISLAGWAYNAKWRESRVGQTQTFRDPEALAESIRLQRRFIASAPEGFPLDGARAILADREDSYRRIHKKEPPK